MKLKTFQVSLSSDLYNMKNTVNQALEFINENKPNLNKNDVYDMKLVLNELLANAIIHGNKENKSKSVYLKMKLKKNSIYTKISDEGKGFDYLNYLSRYNSAKSSQMKENGRGIKLACSLTDCIAFNSLGNEIKFLKKVNPNG